MPPQAAANVVGRIGLALSGNHVGREVGFFPRDGAAEVGAVGESALAHAVNERAEAGGDRRKDDDVVLGLEIGRGAHDSVGDVVVGHLRLFEHEAVPAFVLRVDPGVHQGDARQGHGVTLEVAKVVDRVTQKVVLVATDQAGRPVDPAAMEAAEEQARAARYGKLNDRLAARLEAAASDAELPVSVARDVRQRFHAQVGRVGVGADHAEQRQDAQEVISVVLLQSQTGFSTKGRGLLIERSGLLIIALMPV